ncbi:MAG: hypothetical protein B0D92_01870 [Spirochaeta sp. LUC14_002_19_P3]|nr:MAG: hypothetical protein B0D92_01870 [Spirochaeta sp. LUC14_002_19_P3]
MRINKSARSRRASASRGGILRAIWRFGCQKITIILVPHSEKKSIHCDMSLFTIFFLGLLSLSLIASFFWFSLDFSGKEAVIAARSQDLAATEASLEVIREEVATLISSAGRFRSSLDKTMNILGVEGDSVNSASSEGGDLSSLFNVEQADGHSMSEVSDLHSLRVSLDNSVIGLNDMSRVLSNQKELLSDIPTIWPLKGIRGWVTQIFGPSINPFGRYWYLHRGLDIAAPYGVPIMATADGKVVKKDFDRNGFGYYIDVQHKYGFKTRYAHLQRQMVQVGQRVTQGETIGTVGNTGMSTGPHLHYEVMIGTQLVDPVKFLNMVNSESNLDKITSNLRKYK